MSGHVYWVLVIFHGFCIPEVAGGGGVDSSGSVTGSDDESSTGSGDTIGSVASPELSALRENVFKHKASAFQHLTSKS